MNALIWRDLIVQQMQFEQQQRSQLQQMMQQQLMQQEDDMEEEDEVPEEQRTLFIANLDETKVDDEILYELFIQAGPIEKVSFPKKKSFAFITYVHSFSPVYAMHLYQGVKLFNQNIVVKFNGTTNCPPLRRRLLPPDYDGLARDCIATPSHNPFTEPKRERRSFDNSALRSSRYAAFTDRRDDSPDRRYSRDRSNDNHRRNERSPTRRRQEKDSDKNWTRGPERSRSHSHHGSKPYDKRRF